MREKPHLIKALNILFGVGGSFTPTSRLAGITESMAVTLYEMGYAERAAAVGMRDEWAYRLSPEGRAARIQKAAPKRAPIAQLPERIQRLPDRLKPFK